MMTVIFIVVAYLIAIVLLLISNINNRNFIRTFILYQNIKKRRLKALEKAKPFLAPYKSILEPHKLINKNCAITFRIKKELEGTFPVVSCIAQKKDDNGNLFYFKAQYIGCNSTDMDIKGHDFWTALCMNFSYSTTYNELAKICKETFFLFEENYYKPKNYSDKITQNKKEFININSATETELMNLPGINIVLAKKIIAHRENNIGFSTFEDFIDTFNIKAHFAAQLKNLIKVETPPKTKKKIKGERILDI